MEQLTAFISGLVTVILTVFASSIGLVVAVFILERAISKTFYRKNVEKVLTGVNDKSFLFIKLPLAGEQNETLMEAFLYTLHRLLPTGAGISLEMVSSGQFLRYYIVISKQFKHIVEAQLYAQFPEAEVEGVHDYFSRWEQHTSFVELGFKHHSMHPIKTHKHLEDDLLKNLSAMLSKTDQQEEVAIQLVLQKVGSKSPKRGVRALYHQYANSSVESPIQEKLSQSLYVGKLRFAYHAKTNAAASTKLHTLVNLYKTVKGSHNELVKKKEYFSEDLAKAFKTRLFERGDLWSISELATLYHFPSKGTIVSNVVQTTSKRAPAPDILPREGQYSAKEVAFIAETNYRNERIRFGMRDEDRRRHMYVIGKTGVGKSRFLELLMTSDIELDKGFCLLDPHGDLADAVLQRVPQRRVRDVIYIDPSNRDFPIAFNPLEYTDNYEKRQHIAFFFISIFKKIFASDWNERMEHILRYIILALLETPDSNVLGINRILTDTQYRHRVIGQIKDPVVKQFWANEFSSWNEQYSSQAIVPILNKVGQFVSNPIIRNMVGQQKNTLDFEKFMNEGKIVIINVSKGKLGEDNAALLGSMFITKIQQAALARANIKEEDRRDFYFYIDEFQNFATEAFKSILSESRKYRLNLTIVHQYIDQLSEDIKSSVFGNVASLFVFAVGGDDAAYLAKEFTPTFIADDIISLETREMYVKMSINGRTARPFSARTITTSAPGISFVPDIIHNTQTKYASNRVAVERSIEKWTNTKGGSENGRTDTTEEFPEPIL